jgi:uncharacterized membrane protein YhiD involved in acid resistance
VKIPCLVLVLCTALLLAPASAWQEQAPPQPQQPLQTGLEPHQPIAAIDLASQILSVREALVRLPLAAVLGAALAFRPRRRGTPPRSPAVVQTQIILSVVGAVVMIIVGASLARAFAIAGAANLIRYRAKIDDPKDAGVMLSTLTVGLAAGVGLYALATVGTFFIMIVLGAVESLEPEAIRVYSLRISAKPIDTIRTKVEDLLRRRRLKFELRSSTEEEISFELKVPVERQLGHLPDLILDLDREKISAVEFEEKKPKKA